jgi:hypothetical protein
MAITVKHKFVSTIPDGTDTTVVRPSNWNDTHDLTGLGTMAEQNANSVAITGGTISGVTIPASNLTGTVTVPQGGTGATTFTGYVKGAGTTSLTASSTIPNTDITGLGTASTKDAGAALGVATLDSAGKVPISQIPDSVIGALSYQGTWNASTNTPTLSSSVGTKGYYYVVNVAGTTNLNGITDWQIGDWAVYSGTAWQKVDNTDGVTSVNGYTGAVVLTYTDVGAFPATSTTGTGNVVLATGATQANPTISNYENFTPTTAPSYSEGRVWFDSGNHTLSQYNDVTNNIVHLGEEVQLKVINNTGSSIPNGSPVYITNTSSGQTYPNIALAKADTLATSNVIGLTNGAIANGQAGYVTTIGLLNPANTGTFTVGDILYLSPYSAGQIMNTLPPTGYPVRLGIVAYSNNPNGAIYITKTNVYALASNIVGQVAVANGGTGASTLTGYVKGSGTSAMTASTTIPTTDLSGTVSNAQLANSTITINGNSTALGGSVSVGTVTSVTGTAPVVSSGGNTPAISMAKATSIVDGYLSAIDWNTFNNKQPAGSYLTAVTASTPISGSGTSGSPLVISQATTSTNGYLTSTDWNTFNNKGSGTVTSVSALTLGTTGTDLSSTVATGTTTPVITLNVPTASASNRGALSSTDWSTFNGKQAALVSGTNIKTVNGTSLLGSGDVPVGVLTVTGTAPVVSSGGANPAISMPAATTSVSGYLTSTDWNTFNNKGIGTVTSVSGTTGRITSTGGATPVIDLASGVATAGTTGSSTLIPVVTIDTYGRVTGITTASNPQGTVTSVGGTGTVNGITLTGTVTSSGNLTLGGTLGSITNSQLTNSSITINGIAVSLGGSTTISGAPASYYVEQQQFFGGF